MHQTTHGAIATHTGRGRCSSPISACTPLQYILMDTSQPSHILPLCISTLYNTLSGISFDSPLDQPAHLHTHLSHTTSSRDSPKPAYRRVGSRFICDASASQVAVCAADCSVSWSGLLSSEPTALSGLERGWLICCIRCHAGGNGWIPTHPPSRSDMHLPATPYPTKTLRWPSLDCITAA